MKIPPISKISMTSLQGIGYWKRYVRITCDPHCPHFYLFIVSLSVFIESSPLFSVHNCFFFWVEIMCPFVVYVVLCIVAKQNAVTTSLSSSSLVRSVPSFPTVIRTPPDFPPSGKSLRVLYLSLTNCNSVTKNKWDSLEFSLKECLTTCLIDCHCENKFHEVHLISG